MRMRRLVLPGVVPWLLAACAAAPLSPAQTPRHGATAELVASSAVTLGDDTIRVLGVGQATFNELRRLIDGARSSVDVEVYEFGRLDLASSLAAAHRRGVTVTVIDDPSETTSAATAALLRAAGVDVADYPVRTRMIDHVKLLVVDGSTAVVGGINWGAGSFANHDFDAEVQGPAVHNLRRVFLRDLVTCGRVVAVPDPVADPAVLVGATLPGGEILPMVLGVIAAVRISLDVAMYTLTDAAVVAAIEAAADAGVRVRVLLDPSERPSDPSATSLRAHRVPVELYRSGGEKLHAKAAIADGSTVVFGSANWTVSGFDHNHELDVEIPAAPVVAAAFEAQFNADWASSA
jgi:cardiolipin synthase